MDLLSLAITTSPPMLFFAAGLQETQQIEAIIYFIYQVSFQYSPWDVCVELLPGA